VIKEEDKSFRYLTAARYINYENWNGSENINHIVYIY